VFTLGAYYASQASGYTTYLAVAPAADAHLTLSGNDIFVPSGCNNLAGAYGMGASLGSLRFTSPSLRANMPVDIEPLDVGAVPSSYPPFFDMFDSPIPLMTNEALDAYEMSSVTANAKYIGAWLSSGAITPTNAKSIPVKTTGTTTLVAHTWTAVPLTFPSSLPAARYQCVGARFHSATAILGRFIVPQYPWRPGAIGLSDAIKSDAWRFRGGNAGVWFEFDSRQPPQAEFLATGTEAAETVIMDLVRL
jgi:hypothetical protein